MVLKACYCLTHSCRGRHLDDKVARSHEKADRNTFASRASEISERALQDHYHEIAEYVAAQTVIGNTTHREAPLRGDPFNLLSGAGTSTPPVGSGRSRPSGRERIRRTLDRLGKLDDDVEAFLSRKQRSLSRFSLPTMVVDKPFPFRDLLDEGHELKDRLRLFTLKASGVSELRTSILRKIDAAISDLKCKEDEWTRHISQSKANASRDHVYYASDHHFTHILKTSNPVIQVLFFSVVALNVLASLPRRWCRFLLQMVRYALQLALPLIPFVSMHDNNLLAAIPEDPRTVLKEFHLEGRSTVYAVCPNPKCHAQYKPRFDAPSPIPIYPERCSHRAFEGGSKCGQILLRPKNLNGTLIRIPIKSFVAFSFKDWVANLLSRPLVETELDASWSAENNDRDTLHDIFHGSILREFEGPDGRLFSVQGDEGHYAFSLCVDFFNPLGNKQAGKKKSVGVISLCCLNLPRDERYKPENMFLLGIVPGPAEPSLDCLNHYLSPLVDEMLEFWDPGVFLSQTHQHPSGRVVRCALVAVVCDLPAARKTAGFASAKHEQFCSVCKCKKSRDGYVDRPYESWERRAQEDWRSQAEDYKNATDKESREKLFQDKGLRWSELLRLPYFDPTRFVVVDAMHNLFLGLIQEHCKNVLGIDLAKQKGEKVLSIVLDQEWQGFPQKERKDVVYLKDALESSLEIDDWGEEGKADMIRRFGRRHHLSLAYISKMVSLPLTGAYGKGLTRAALAKALVEWRMLQRTSAGTSGVPELSAGHALSERDIEAIRSDIRSLTAPSWTAGIPGDLGSPRHGKLKADQWRLLGTVYLPASLIKQWGSLSGDDPQHRFRRKLLEATICLFTAVSIATAHTTSQDKANQYLSNLQAYVDLIRQLFPNYKFKPNHHMAFHIHEYLLMYGPVHSWWCFPFERIIGMLQRFPTNGIYGEYEETIARAFTKSANIRGLLLKSNCPPALRNCRPFFEQLLNGLVRDNGLSRDILGTASEEVEGEPDASPLEGKETRLPDDVLRCIRSQGHRLRVVTTGVLSSYVNIGGLTFTVSSRHTGNSQVMLMEGSDVIPMPAIIHRIFHVEVDRTVTTYALVERLSSADPGNTFQEFASQRMTVHAKTGRLCVVETRAILSHFARLDLDDNSCLIISLSHS